MNVGLLILSLLVASLPASAAVVTGRVTIESGAPVGDFAVRIDYTDTQSFFNDLVLSTVDADTFGIAGFTLGSPFSAYLVADGATFTPAYASGNTPLASNIDSSGIGNQFDILVGQSVFLAFYTEELLPDGPSFGDQYAWIEISNTGSGLTSLGDATALDTGGIIVGTTTSVPEPGFALIVLGLCGFYRRRR